MEYMEYDSLYAEPPMEELDFEKMQGSAFDRYPGLERVITNEVIRRGVENDYDNPKNPKTGMRKDRVMAWTNVEIIRQIGEAYVEMTVLSAMIRDIKPDKARELTGACDMLQEWAEELKKGERGTCSHDVNIMNAACKHNVNIVARLKRYREAY